MAGVTAMESRTAAVTVKVASSLIAPRVAVMVVEPTVLLVARPPVAIVATVVLELLQVTSAVRSGVEASEKVPVAVNCCILPAATEGVAGVTCIDCSVVAVTVSVVLPLIAPEVAVMIVVPASKVVARPVLSIVAFAGVPLVQVTLLVISAVEPSE